MRFERQEPEQDIPKEFYNSETELPHKNCLVCDKSLEDQDCEYIIEKMMRQVASLELSEVLFEYAICIDCAENMRGEMSKQTLRNIENKMRSYRHVAINHALLGPEDRLKRCMFSGKATEACSEYAMYAHCRGDRMLVGVFPYVVSDTIMDELTDEISNETLDMLDDFKGRYFGGPPELENIINPKRFVPL